METSADIKRDVERLVAAGPFYDGIDDDFCAVCHAYFLIGEDHKPDCAWVRLVQALDIKIGDDDG